MSSEKTVLETQLRNAIRTRNQEQLVDAMQAMVRRGSTYIDVYYAGARKEGLTLREWHRLLDHCRIQLDLGGIAR